MDLGAVFPQFMSGDLIARVKWSAPPDGVESYLRVETAPSGDKSVLYYRGGVIGDYQPNREDLLANDWLVL